MHPLVDHLIEAGVKSGHRLNDDFNGTSQLGIGRFQLTQRSGVRCSAASAYLHPARDRVNLRVLADTLVLRPLFLGRRAVGVSYQSIVTAKRKLFSLKGKSSSRRAHTGHLKSSCSQVF
jgi:choline dehydrogenase